MQCDICRTVDITSFPNFLLKVSPAVVIAFSVAPPVSPGPACVGLRPQVTHDTGQIREISGGKVACSEQMVPTANPEENHNCVTSLAELRS
mgnify:FL=1